MAIHRFTYSISNESVSEIESRFAPSSVHGADIRFHGVVRDSEEGRRISGIDYSHYDEMALKMLARVGEELAKKHPDHLAEVHHRVGFVAAGEASIIIRVQTTHSKPAFEILENYLAKIKTTVPIWKRPVFEE